MSALCPQGHESTESDYCSVCGIAMSPAEGAALPSIVPSSSMAREGTEETSQPVGTSAAGASLNACPACGEPRSDPDARFCEVCRYDFVQGTQGPPPVVSASETPKEAPPSPGEHEPAARETPPLVATNGQQWDAVVTVDPLLDTDPDPDLPVPGGEPERVFPIDLPETLVGRRDDRRDIRPEIPLHDPGVSHRHAKLLRQPGGRIAVLDLASTNGTSVNGTELPPGTPRELEDGDALTIGRWTRIVVRIRP